MSGLNRLGLPATLASSAGRIQKRTWWLAGAAVFVVLALIVAAAIVLLSWFWGQAPTAVDAGKRLGGEAVARVEQVAPGISERLNHWAPGLREQLGRWIPAVAPAPAQDVSGTDIGPVPRYPGLVRSHFARDGQTVEVAFTGVAPFESVLAHYLQGFAAAGYSAEVMTAGADHERHRFRREPEAYEFALDRRPGGRVELRLTLSGQP